MAQPYIGIDIIEIYRFRKVIDRWGQRFLRRIYTDGELQLCRNKIESLAVRFSGKEAVIKALNPSEFTVNWKDIEILSEPNGKPQVLLRGQIKERAMKLGLERIDISLSHSRENAIAMVVGIGEN